MTGPRTLSDRARERVAALESGNGEWRPPIPRAACTVIVVRDGDEGVQTYLIRRAETMAFAPRMHVFPGGRVDAIDSERAMHLSLTEERHRALAARASVDPDGLAALYSCAVRELEEEVGVVIGHTDESGALHIDAEQLPIVGHMVTPEIEDRRYDVRFFVAPVASDTHVEAMTTEAVDGFWISAREALRRNAQGELAMLTPTIMRLQELSAARDVADYLQRMRSAEVIPLMPRASVTEDGSVHWVMVNERTGDIVDDGVRGPQAMETDGAPIHEDIT